MAYNLDQLVALRHHLHQHPEVSRKEVKTAQYVRQFIEEHAKPDAFYDLDGAGFACVYHGENQGKNVMIRAELDALPIHEINQNLPYRSLYDGVGHKCGHDGHMTILAGLAQSLNQRTKSGNVILLFQPDEETGTGARNCYQHPNFKHLKPDYVFALHNLPGFELGEIICKKSTFASAVKYGAIKFAGKEAHSAQPETGHSPARAMAELTLFASKLEEEYTSKYDYALCVPIYNQMGVASSGVAPAFGEVHFTLRGAQTDHVNEMWQQLWLEAERLAKRDHLRLTQEIIEEYGATLNSENGYEMIKQAAHKNDAHFTQIESPFRWGEDFGELTQHIDGAMFGLGAGIRHPDLHNPDYDFPDELIEKGVNMFAELIHIAQNPSN